MTVIGVMAVLASYVEARAPPARVIVDPLVVLARRAECFAPRRIHAV